MNTRQYALLAFLTVLCLVGTERASAFYNPGTGRWLNKDPMEEAGGANLYQHTYNRPTNAIDRDGLSVVASVYGTSAPTAPNPVTPPPTPGPGDGPWVPVDEVGSESELLGRLYPPVTFSNPDAADLANGRRPKEACAELARLSGGKNMSFYYPADGSNRATGAVGVFWNLAPSNRATVSAPGWRAANYVKGTADRGHLIPRVLGGENSFRNITTQEATFNQVTMKAITSTYPKDFLGRNSGCYLCLAVVPKYKASSLSYNSLGHLRRGFPLPAPHEFFIARIAGDEVYINTLKQPNLIGDYRREKPPWRISGVSVAPLNY